MDTLQNTTKATACVSDGDIDLAENGQSLSSILDLTGKIAIVTGGARGLGFHVVNRLMKER